MANALKTLFTDIAESIRGGLPDEGLMKPNVFPSKIDEIVALLENAGSSEGGTGSSGSVGNLKFASGSYNVGTNRNRATVTHGFDTMPDLIIVWYTGFYGGTKEEYIEEFPLELAWGMKSKFSSKTLSGYVIPGFGVSASSGINNYADSIGIYCPDQYTFQFGSSANDGGGRLLTGARYNWLAISGMGGAIGGVDSDLVKYVTFIGADGTEFCEKMPVLNGDDCKNPITHWNLSAPTKESTVSQVFTYNGWALTDGGSAQTTTALANVTEDRTVYAAFRESVREYTIMFYDDDGTFLKSQTLAYGATPSYTPEKAGHKFTGWTPEITAVVGEASYTANWIEQVEFATAPWSYISELSESGRAEEFFSIGDKKSFEFTHDGTTYSVNAEIIAFNHDEKSDGSGNAGITLCVDVGTFPGQMNASAKTYGSATANYAGGYGNSDIRTTLNGTVLNALPEEMRTAIKSVNKQWHNPTTDTTQTTSENLWLFSMTECGLTKSTQSAPNALLKTEGARYNFSISTRKTYSGTEGIFWLRSGLGRNTGVTQTYQHNFTVYARTNYPYGYPVTGLPTNTILFGFCI